MLSPMDLMIKVRNHLTEKGAAITGKTPWVPAYAFSQEAKAASADQRLIGDIITETEISACTTCRACEDACPVMNEHVDHIIDLGRDLVKTEGKMDPDAQRVDMNIERQENPWGLSKKDRIKCREQDESVYIPTIKELKKQDQSFDQLSWVSSIGSYDNRS